MDPYEVLGVPQNATDEQIKEAYKELVKKYHPDKYQDNPLADLAEEKLQEVNEAYDMLMKGGGGSGYGNTGGYSYSSAGSYGGSQSQSSSASGSASSSAVDFRQVRRNIDAGNLAEAERILHQTADQSAEWYFLNGVIASRKGWYDEAVGSLQTACNMAPANLEYRRHLASLSGRSNQYQNTAMNRGYNGSSDDLCCQMLQCYICADCCCDCI